MICDVNMSFHLSLGSDLPDSSTDFRIGRSRSLREPARSIRPGILSIRGRAYTWPLLSRRFLRDACAAPIVGAVLSRELPIFDVRFDDREEGDDERPVRERRPSVRHDLATREKESREFGTGKIVASVESIERQDEVPSLARFQLGDG